MSDDMKLCRSCMGAVSAGVSRCPGCGYDGHQQNSPESLPIGFRLAGRYVVGMRRGGDADCAVYVGYDCTLNRQVEIREYLPEGGCTRNSSTMELVPNFGSELFYKTALMDFSDLYKNLHRIEGVPGIIRTSDFLEANATAYAVLDTFDGVTLREFLSMAGGSISCEQALKILEPVFAAAEAIHKVNLIHRGISPETIFLNRNGDVRLGGFATSLVRTKGTEVSGQLYSGYAAPEQYSATGWQDMSTDVYALAAVFYRCVSGITPRDAEQRRSYDTLSPLSEAKPGIDTALSSIISAAMVLDPQLRTQEAPRLLAALKSPASWRPSGEAPVLPLEKKVEENMPPVVPPKRKKQYPAWIERLGVTNFWIMIVSIVIIVMLATATVILGNSIFGNKEPEPEPEPEEDLVVVQNFIGYSEQEARALAQADPDLEYKFADIFRAGEVDVVADQSPKAETKVAKGTIVTLYINREAIVNMPNLIGFPLEVAIQRLEDLQVQYFVLEEVDDSQTAGYIIAQDPPQGTVLSADTRVTITVCIHSSSTPDPEPEPEPDPNPDPGATPWMARREED